MAPTMESISKKLEASASKGYDLSTKLYRVLQVLPSAVFEYGCFAGQILYLASNLEQINNILPTVKLTSDNQALKDLEKLLKFTEEAYSEVEEALPSRPFDGAEVDLMLPLDAPALENQIEALQIAATMVMAIFQLAGTRPSSENTVPSSSRFTEAIVNQVKKIVRDLKCTQMREGKRRGAALRRAKTHKEITEFLDAMLVIPNEEKKLIEEGENVEKKDSKDEKAQDEDSKDDKEDDPAEEDDVKLEHYGAHPKEDGMPEYVRHNPDNVYAKVPVKDVDTRSLVYYNLPYSKAKENPNYYIIWKPMEYWETENVFQHTKKLRINEEHENIDPKLVVKTLLQKWLGIEAEVRKEEEATSDFEELEKNLDELRAQDEKRSDRLDRRPAIRRDRSWSPSPPPRSRVPLPRPRVHHYPRRYGETSKTEYYRSWEGQLATLNNALTTAGWRPVYMRGTDAGQTWFYGSDVIHVRRFNEEYTPQDGPFKPSEKEGEEVKELKEYLLIGAEWLEEEALYRQGFQFQLLPNGQYSLDPRLTWGDIEAMVYASSTFREERLYRKFRSAENGDLYQPKALAVPDMDYLNGPPIPERERGNRNRAHVPAPAPISRENGHHIPHRLETMPEEPAEHVFRRKQEVQTPGAESHDSFVEISK